MMARWGLEGMQSFEQKRVSCKERREEAGCLGPIDGGRPVDVKPALTSEAA